MLPPGVNGPVYATAVIGRDLYVGGIFSIAGKKGIPFLARWDGRTWRSLGDGINGMVSALAVQGTDLIVGGQFTMAGSVPVTNIARWTGQQWEALGPGLGGSHGFGNRGAVVWSLTVSGDNIYAGGLFDFAGEIGVTNIAMWDGTNWWPLGTGVDSEADPLGSHDPSAVYGLAILDSDLYAAGVFSRAGEVSATNIARWDGTQWNPLESGVYGGELQFSVNGKPRSGLVYTLEPVMDFGRGWFSG